MYSLVALLGLLSLSEATTLQLGYGVQVGPSENASPCVIDVDIPVEVAGSDCSVEIYVDQPSLGRDYTVYWKNKLDTVGSNQTTFAEANKVEEGYISNRYSVRCDVAGNFALGVTVDTLPGASILGNDDLAVMIKKGKNYVIKAVSKMRTAPLILSQGDWALFNLTLPYTATPHWDIDSAIDSRLDDYEYYFAAKGQNILSRDESFLLKGDATSDVTAGSRPAGEYVFGVYVKSIVSTATIKSTTFRVTHMLNELAKQYDPWPLVLCPSGMCGEPDAQSCSGCTANDCYWCDSLSVCSNTPALCSNATVSSKGCANVEAECFALGACGDCVGNSRCVWCERPGLADVCSSGKNDLGVECAYSFQTAIKEHDKCPEVISNMNVRERCAAHTTCSACIDDKECGYCDKSRVCMAQIDFVTPDQCPDDGLTLTYDLVSADNGELQCPPECSASNRGTCEACLKLSGCTWDDAQGKCARSDDIKSSNGTITDSLQCPSADEFCGNLTTCGSCLENRSKNCLWCDPLLESPKCTTGKDGLGESCQGLTDQKTNDCNKCSEVLPTCKAAASSLVVAIGVVLVTVVALF